MSVSPAAATELQTAFANASVVVVIKPAGWLSVPSRLGKDDARPCVGRHLETQLGQRLWPVHRLDFEVSGLLLFAKTAAAHKQANHWFETRLVHKTYEALSEATADGAALLRTTEDALSSQADAGARVWTWRSQMARGKRRAYLSEHGKAAETAARYLGKVDFRGCSVHHWSLNPVTGRPHQLRFDLARHGFPIIGDQLYGAHQPYPPLPTGPGSTASAADTIALRCQRLDFAGCAGADALGLPPFVALPSLLVAQDP